MWKLTRRLVSDGFGMQTMEYALLTALLVTALVTAIIMLTSSASTRFGTVQANSSIMP